MIEIKVIDLTFCFKCWGIKNTINKNKTEHLCSSLKKFKHLNVVDTKIFKIVNVDSMREL